MHVSKKLTLEVIIPTYNGAKTIQETIQCLLGQSKQDFTILVHDDCSQDNTEEIVSSFRDPRIRFEKNKNNLRCQQNLEVARKKTQADIVFWLCQDDILSDTALEETYQAFASDPAVGAVVRPYFWFGKTHVKPIRATGSFHTNQNEYITMNDEYSRIKLFFDATTQLSGLAYRAKYFDHPFHEDIFPGHIYVFASILKNHPVVFLKNYTVAVRIESSQSRTISSIYDESPIQSWVRMFETLFHEKKNERFRTYFIREYVAVNYVGLLQIRNFSHFSNYWREVKMLVKYRKQNLISPMFLAMVLFCTILPTQLITLLVDEYKERILSRVIPDIPFRYTLK